MGLFVGIGAFGGVIAVGSGLASLNTTRPKIDELVQKSKRSVVAVAENFKKAVGGLAGNFMNFFGKKKEE
jgi:hypothetical protein